MAPGGRGLGSAVVPNRHPQCEGQICRVKLLKRLGYGRAKLDLFRQRILHRLSVPLRLGKQRRKIKQPAAA
jgi:hypothetical protein